MKLIFFPPELVHEATRTPDELEFYSGALALSLYSDYTSLTDEYKFDLSYIALSYYFATLNKEEQSEFFESVSRLDIFRDYNLRFDLVDHLSHLIIEYKNSHYDSDEIINSIMTYFAVGIAVKADHQHSNVTKISSDDCITLSHFLIMHNTDRIRKKMDQNSKFRDSVLDELKSTCKPKSVEIEFETFLPKKDTPASDTKSVIASIDIPLNKPETYITTPASPQEPEQNVCSPTASNKTKMTVDELLSQYEKTLIGLSESECSRRRTASILLVNALNLGPDWIDQLTNIRPDFESVLNNAITNSSKTVEGRIRKANAVRLFIKHLVERGVKTPLQHWRYTN